MPASNCAALKIDFTYPLAAHIKAEQHQTIAIIDTEQIEKYKETGGGRWGRPVVSSLQRTTSGTLKKTQVECGK
jgi:hypothetical protein